MASRVVVVGLGSAGSVIASVLAEVPGVELTVIEAGDVPTSREAFPPAVLNARTLEAALPGRSFSATYPAQLAPGVHADIVRGHIAGGSSAINGAYFHPAPASDWNSWRAVVGAQAWTPAEVTEANTHLEQLGLTAQPSNLDHPLWRETLSALEAAGVSEAADEAEAHHWQWRNLGRNVGEGSVRLNAALACLPQIRQNPRVRIIANTEVEAVTLTSGQVTGVTALSADGSRFSVDADLVVLAAGAVSSSALVMRSGIGPATELRELGIPLTVEQPAIGSSFHDHPGVAIQFQTREAGAEGPWPEDPFAMTLRMVDDEDAMIEVLPMVQPVEQLLGMSEQPQPVSWLISLMNPQSRGVVSLESRTTARPPRVDYRYLESSWDRRALWRAAQQVTELVESPAFHSVVETTIDPPRGAEADTEWLSRHLRTSYHTCSSVPAGLDDRSATDAWGAMRGVSGLVVADLSILPTAPTVGPSHTAMLLGALIGQHLAGQLEAQPGKRP